MNVTAKFTRPASLFSLVFILVFSSCAGSINSVGAIPTEDSQETSNTFADASLANTNNPESNSIETSSRILTTPENDTIGIELVEGANSDQLVINSRAGSSDFTVNRLSNPDRVVIDINGQSVARNRTFDTTDSEYLSRIRVGAHPDKSRIVLDLAQNAEVQHAVDNSTGRLVVTLSGDVSTAMVANVPPAADLALPAETAPEVTLVNDQEISAEKNEAKPLLMEEQVIPSGSLNGLALEQLGENSNMLVADVSNLGIHSLEKTAPSEYVLRIKDTKLSPEATGVIAPANSGLIRSVRPTSDGSDVALRIFAQPGTILEARASADKIVVSAAAETDRMRAQAAPEKTEPAADVAAKPAPVAEGAEVKVSEESSNSETDRLLEELAAPQYTGRLISLDLQDTDIDNALRIIAEVSNLNIIASDDVTGKVTLRLIDVPWDQALDVILKTNGLDKVQEGNVIRIAPVEKLRQEREALKQLRITQEELEPLQVKYIRISYAKASELKPLIETVVSERGVVTYDERSNQIIVKDIAPGIKNVSELVSKVDLRTPQVLLETQIVEASRSLLRDLGTELGFEYIQSPETGNPTGMNFPNTVNVGGSLTPGSNVGSSFPAAVSPGSGSAISMLLGSADGSKTLDLRITSLEQEGRIRVVSRPAVATTNNKQAIIKSVEKIRVKTPQGGLSVATGQGASASGSSAVATETIEIGITLEVTPQASPDYYVLLDINAKSSNFGSRVVEGIPSEIERSATSTVLVSSGQTFAMGGIYKITDNDSVDGVPFLKDVPFFGYLFRKQTVNNSDEELLFFITPRIVEGSFDDATMKVTP